MPIIRQRYSPRVGSHVMHGTPTSLSSSLTNRDPNINNNTNSDNNIVRMPTTRSEDYNNYYSSPSQPQTQSRDRVNRTTPLLQQPRASESPRSVAYSSGPSTARTATTTTTTTGGGGGKLTRRKGQKKYQSSISTTTTSSSSQQHQHNQHPNNNNNNNNNNRQQQQQQGYEDVGTRAQPTRVSNEPQLILRMQRDHISVEADAPPQLLLAQDLRAERAPVLLERTQPKLSPRSGVNTVRSVLRGSTTYSNNNSNKSNNNNNNNNNNSLTPVVPRGRDELRGVYGEGEDFRTQKHTQIHFDAVDEMDHIRLRESQGGTTTTALSDYGSCDYLYNDPHRVDSRSPSVRRTTGPIVTEAWARSIVQPQDEYLLYDRNTPLERGGSRYNYETMVRRRQAILMRERGRHISIGRRGIEQSTGSNSTGTVGSISMASSMRSPQSEPRYTTLSTCMDPIEEVMDLGDSTRTRMVLMHERQIIERGTPLLFRKPRTRLFGSDNRSSSSSRGSGNNNNNNKSVSLFNNNTSSNDVLQRNSMIAVTGTSTTVPPAGMELHPTLLNRRSDNDLMVSSILKNNFLKQERQTTATTTTNTNTINTEENTVENNALLSSSYTGAAVNKRPLLLPSKVVQPIPTTHTEGLSGKSLFPTQASSAVNSYHQPEKEKEAEKHRSEHEKSEHLHLQSLSPLSVLSQPQTQPRSSSSLLLLDVNAEKVEELLSNPLFALRSDENYERLLFMQAEHEAREVLQQQHATSLELGYSILNANEVKKDEKMPPRMHQVFVGILPVKPQTPRRIHSEFVGTPEKRLETIESNTGKTTHTLPSTVLQQEQQQQTGGEAKTKLLSSSSLSVNNMASTVITGGGEENHRKNMLGAARHIVLSTPSHSKTTGSALNTDTNNNNNNNNSTRPETTHNLGSKLKNRTLKRFTINTINSNTHEGTGSHLPTGERTVSPTPAIPAVTPPRTRKKKKSGKTPAESITKRNKSKAAILTPLRSEELCSPADVSGISAITTETLHEPQQQQDQQQREEVISTQDETPDITPLRNGEMLESPTPIRRREYSRGKDTNAAWNIAYPTAESLSRNSSASRSPLRRLMMDEMPLRSILSTELHNGNDINSSKTPNSFSTNTGTTTNTTTTTTTTTNNNNNNNNNNNSGITAAASTVVVVSPSNRVGISQLSPKSHIERRGSTTTTNTTATSTASDHEFIYFTDESDAELNEYLQFALQQQQQVLQQKKSGGAVNDINALLPYLKRTVQEQGHRRQQQQHEKEKENAPQVEKDKSGNSLTADGHDIVDLKTCKEKAEEGKMDEVGSYDDDDDYYYYDYDDMSNGNGHSSAGILIEDGTHYVQNVTCVLTAFGQLWQTPFHDATQYDKLPLAVQAQLLLFDGPSLLQEKEEEVEVEEDKEEEEKAMSSTSGENRKESNIDDGRDVCVVAHE